MEQQTQITDALSTRDADLTTCPEEIFRSTKALHYGAAYVRHALAEKIVVYRLVESTSA